MDKGGTWSKSATFMETPGVKLFEFREGQEGGVGTGEGRVESGGSGGEDTGGGGGWK